MTLTLSTRVLDTSWSDPDEVATADRLMRVLYAYGRNIEKCIAMTEKYCPDDQPHGTDDNTAAARDELHRRLVRYADRLGPEELARRLRERYAEKSPARLGILGEDGSTPSQDN
ncbi:MAG: hypothetical protein AAF603_00450 [Pseudomonadota bacterium]